MNIKVGSKWIRVLPEVLAGEVITVVKGYPDGRVHFCRGRALLASRFLATFKPKLPTINLKEIYEY